MTAALGGVAPYCPADFLKKTGISIEMHRSTGNATAAPT